MHLKIDTKQKIKYLRAYLSQLRQSPLTSPFTTLNPNECGFFDYTYITKQRRTLVQIDKDLKDNKYENVREVVEDLRGVFECVGEYFLLGDPIQGKIEGILGELGRFQGRFWEEFREVRGKDSKCTKREDTRPNPANKQKQKQDQNPQPNPSSSITPTTPNPPPSPLLEYNRKSTFGQKLQMFFYLKSHQDNMEYIKSIGESYGIGREEGEGEFVIRLEANAGGCLWLELLQKKDQ